MVDLAAGNGDLVAELRARLDVLEHADGLINAISGLGTARDPASRTTIAATSTELSRPQLDELYRYDGYAGRIIDHLPNECVREGWRVVSVDEETREEQEPFQADLERLGVAAACSQVHKWARLYGGGALVLGVVDGGMRGAERDEDGWAQPIDEGSVDEVLTVQVVDRHELTPETWDADPWSPGFGRPLVYQMQLAMVGAASMRLVHRDRVLRFEGLPLPRQLAAQALGWGDSVLNRVRRKLLGLESCEAAMELILHDWNVLVWRIAGLANMVRGPNSADLVKRYAALNLAKSLTNSIPLDVEESVEILTRNVAGLGDVYDRLSRSFAASADMPATLLFGDAPAGLTSDDASGRTYWYDRVAAEQQQRYRPVLERLCRLLMLSRQGPTGGREIAFRVAFEPLLAPSALEEEQEQKTRAERDEVYIRSGVLAADEVRESRFGGSSGDVRLLAGEGVPLLPPERLSS